MDAVAVFMCKVHAVPVWLHWASATVYALLFVMCLAGAWQMVRHPPHIEIPAWVLRWQLGTFWLLGATLASHLLKHEVCTWP